ncbi:unnamed protein product [Malus baccata var. baccata]
MAKLAAPLFSYALSSLLLTASLSCEAIDSDDRKVHIVYMGSLPNDEAYSPPSHHLGMLERVVGSNSPANVLVQSYKRSFNGFASLSFQLQTTRSWDFMGVSENIIRNATAESDVIVGLIDTGIWPESDSFKDEGVCKGGQNFASNNKIIGARFYNPTESARDIIGHGTHTASTAAARNAVKDVDFYGLAQGTARGGVPSSKIAAYSVCNLEGCSADGLLAIGAFHAMGKGILTSNAAGNNGPEEGTVSSVSPWILTVAASSIDRRIIDKVVLGNRRTLVGSSVNSFTLNGTSFPLIYGKDASRICPELSAGNCEPDCLDGDLIKGKIVLCDQFVGNFVAHKAGALCSVLNTSNADASFIVPLPATGLSNQEYNVIESHLKSAKDPQADILPSEVIKDDTAPVVVSFSSHKSRVKYSIASRTSMACPHASGVAAYIKTIRLDWSPAAIKSSLMTTTKPMNGTNTSPDPGLVYDASREDYIKLLCSFLDDSKVRIIAGDNTTCPTGPEKGSPKDHNYPSMGAKVTPMKSFTVTFPRTVKNVGPATSTYKAKILPDPKVDIKVVPEVLSFKSLNEEKKFNLTIIGTGLPDGSHVSTELIWSDETRSIRSPILISSSVM